MKIIYFILFLLLINCDGQNKKNECNSNSSLKRINELPEVQKKEKYIDSLTNHNNRLSYMVNEEKFKNKDFFCVKVGYNSKLRWETYYIFYLDKENCNDIFFLDTISNSLITLTEWRNIKKQKMNNIKIEFKDLFNESSNIRFTPKDLEKSDIEIQNFKKKLLEYESQHSIIEDFDERDLSRLINYEVFENCEWYIDNSWLEYFIIKYKIDVRNLKELFKTSIQQEDYNAIKILLNHGYIITKKDINVANETKLEADKNIKYNKTNKGLDEQGNPTFYDDKYSKIIDILWLLKTNYLKYIIQDSDGYTNLRKDKNTTSEILQKVQSGEEVDVLDNTGDWWKVETKEGKTGYIHKSRIKSSNNSVSVSVLRIYNRADFSSFSKEIQPKEEVEYINKVNGWDFIRVNGTVGYLPTEEQKQEFASKPKRKNIFLADDEPQPIKKKGFWDSLFG